MIPYINIALTIGGRTLRITHTTPWRLESITGIEAVDVTPYIEGYASRDGAWYGGERIEPRYITLVTQYVPRSSTEQARHDMITFLNPHSEGELTIERTGITRKIGVRMAAGATFSQPNIRRDRLTVTIQLVAPNPYWQDEAETQYRFLRTIPLLSFPWALPSTSGINIRTDTVEIQNFGDVPVGIVCRMRCNGSSTVNPSITSQGKTVKALVTLLYGDELIIDTRVGHKAITLNGTRAMIFSQDSNFFTIPVGTSTITIAADSGIEYCDTDIIYNFEYLGV